METETLRKTFALVADECKNVLQIIPANTLKGGLGEGEPIFNETEIWFNGDEKKGLDHETFGITWKGEGGFDFCKTARKPYDLAVCFCLLSFHNHFPREIFQLSSDGGEEEWQKALDLYNEITDNPLEIVHCENPFKSTN